MTDLIFWRHAEAEDFSASGLDTERALTKRGAKDAAKMAKWLSKKLPADTKLLVSPALRCQQTAAALHEMNNLAVTTLELLSVNSSPQQMMDGLAAYADSKVLLLVGHQPNLGILIAHYLAMPERAVSVKKGAVWWLRKGVAQDSAHYRIHAVMLPD
ncbi:MAG: phosphohistidine phosphatase [Methylotenera sp. 24-45-7]|jgi:phosphohistidine phosphatase|nr:MAG: phosphohistidine phosphatase [Mehylophilales bacterium 35-46-6]OYY80495.1 MAG: phosphohistidine phosphatase [Methylophilales bacterium 16-45-9]OYZ40395.1 MAG: phosphohistidine phosphatase [Methylotenera sp. 24-45-7]OZA08954.1 MAG: phosphohistidine phosphatase [Methylotenera sp. 17-45-7]OZA54364.1 MAG: phosphohistidine phosphatase [Methylophilales bacterium 39-45-7]HQS36604.1 histidine phosphatase family protein [Methylotenera sp.]